MERGEVEGAAVDWTTVKTAKAQWLRERKIKVVLQDLPKRGHDLQDVPALGELGDTPEADAGRPMPTPAPSAARSSPRRHDAGATKALRDGFIAMTKDPDFIADAKKINAEIDIGTRRDLLAAVNQTLDMPESVLRRAREIFEL